MSIAVTDTDLFFVNIFRSRCRQPFFASWWGGEIIADINYFRGNFQVIVTDIERHVFRIRSAMNVDGWH